MAKGFEKPNHTQTPNSFFASLPNIKSASELKIILAIIRRTFGWHKESDKISLSQLEEDTGLTRESVSQGIQSALDHSYIKRKRDGQGHIYSLKVVGKSDWSEKPTSRKSRLKLVGKADPKVVGNVDPQKKEIKEKKEISAHARLMQIHSDRLRGKIPDPAAQGSAIKWLLQNYTETQAAQCYAAKVGGDRWRVSWLTVKSEIGDWLQSGKPKTNGKRYTHHGEEIIEETEDYVAVMGPDGTPTYRGKTAKGMAMHSNYPIEVFEQSFK